MFSFVYLRKRFLKKDFNMQRISRTKGISVFFGLTALVGVLFAVPVVEETLFLSSGLIGISRIFFSNLLI